MDKTRIIEPRKSHDPYATRFEEPLSLFEEQEGAVFGDCVIERPLGMGGAAAVYLARHTKLETRRALKVLKAEHVGNVRLRERFMREARISARLNHPGIVHVYDTGEQNGKPYIEMEYVEGWSLRRLLAEHGALPVYAALAVAEQVGEALAFAHASRIEDAGKGGVIHRDVKPENILVRPDGQVKLVDFGIAKAVECDGNTLQGAVMGTCGYMPMEQIDGKTVDARSDLYSLSVVFYEMLAGRLPYQGDTYTALIKNIVSSQFVPLRKLSKALARDVESLVHQGICAEKEGRFQDAEAFLTCLRKLKTDKNETPSGAIRRWFARKPEKPLKKNKIRPLPAAVFLLLIAAIAVFQLNPRTPPAGRRSVKTASAPQNAPVSVRVSPRDTTSPAIIPVPTAMPADIAPAEAKQIPEPRKRSAVTAKSVSRREPSAGPLEQAIGYFNKEDYFSAERLFNQAAQDTSVRVDASYYLVRIMDARFRAGHVELKSELTARLQRFIRDNGKRESCREMVRDAKERLLYVIGH